MKKIGIVSSFDVRCGNATYSKALVDGIPAGYVSVPIEVPLSLQESHDSISIAKVIEKVCACDAVNIQLELALYGPTPAKSAKFLQQIINNAQKISITMHRVEEKPQDLLKMSYKALKNGGFKRIIKTFMSALVYREIFSAYKKIIRFANSRQATFIVHTYREEERIKKICPTAKILVHPIVWPLTMQKDTAVINLKEKFAKDLPIIGLFGFISAYKNFEQVIRVADVAGFNVLLAGGTHPKAYWYGSPDNSSSSYKVSDITFNKLDSCYIYTAPDDDTLYNFMAAVDLVVVPYLETGQSGSGIASLAVQYGKRVIFSDTCLATELIPFLNKRPFLFDVSSDASLIYAVRDSLKFNQERELSFAQHNFKTNIDTYLLSLGIEANS